MRKSILKKFFRNILAGLYSRNKLRKFQLIKHVAFISILQFIIFACSKEENIFDHSELNWTLVFHDEFSGDAVDQSQWSLYYSAGHASHGLRRPEAFSVQDGNLVVTAQMLNGNLVSGGMAHRLNLTYGKFEFRVRTEQDPSEATSGVILTWPQSENWPMDGENDMYETVTQSDRSTFSTFIHFGTSPSTQYYYGHPVDATQWHIVGMEWTADTIRIFRDEEPVWTLTDTMAIPDVPHHLCIQLDAFKTSMTGVVRMYVDWVKIYSLEEIQP